MKKFAGVLAGIAGICSVVFGGVPEYSVDAQGKMCITLNGEKILMEDAPAMVDADWRRVAEFAVAPGSRKENMPNAVCSWTDGSSVMTRSVEFLPDGKLQLSWSIRFLNGVSAARHVELNWFLTGARQVKPSGNPPRTLTVDVGGETVEIAFAGFSIPWVFEQQQKSGIRLVLAWNYDPAAINRIESTMLIRVIQKKEAEEK